LVGISDGAFLGQKLVYALVGLCLPSVVWVVAALVRVRMPWAIPVLVSIGLGAGAFVMPDLMVRDKAARARREFSRALAAYIDLVALERSCGAGTKQALDTAADVGDSWVFRRLRECLDQATWVGRPPWDGLRDMADDLALPDLGDLADIMRLTGTQGAGVYTILRARAQSMRTAMMSDELAKANEVNEKMSIPVSVLGVVFLAILIGPALMGMMTR
jgi:Flp pilus assembly protein TadB